MAMAIGLVLVMAITSMILVSQTHERITTGSNDMSQNGAFTAAILDNSLRSAGAGFSQYWNRGLMGCKIHAKRSGSQILPRTRALPTPFGNFMDGAAGIGDLRLAPLLIGEGQSSGGSDVLISMSGLSNVGDVPRVVRSYSDSEKKLYLENTVSIHQNDVIIIAREGVADCILTQVDGGASTPFIDTAGQTALPLGGAYFNAQSANGSVTLDNMTVSSAGRAILAAIGNTNNLQMQVLGVGTDNVLYRYDLLQSSGKDASEAMAEGVVAMRAIYSVDNNADNPDLNPSPAWQAPNGNFAINNLISQNPPARIRSILAVRVALLLRSVAKQQNIAASSSYTLLKGTSAADTINLSDADRYYTHRLVEITIPLRPMMMRLRPPEEELS